VILHPDDQAGSLDLQMRDPVLEWRRAITPGAELVRANQDALAVWRRSIAAPALAQRDVPPEAVGVYAANAKAAQRWLDVIVHRKKPGDLPPMVTR